MATISIGGVVYEVYGNDAEANTYFKTRIGAGAWDAVEVLDKRKGLLTATRYLDRLRWVGTKTSPSQPLAWPREGVTDLEGAAVVGTPDKVKFACYELAFALTQDASILDNASGTTGNKKRVKAGSVEVEYFRMTSGTRLPTVVHEWIREFLTGIGEVEFAIASGTSEEGSFFNTSYDVTLE
jgi:hypothetical protein